MNENELIRYRQNNALSYRLLFLILLCSSVFTLFGTAFQLYMDYRKDVQSIENAFIQIRDSFLQPLAVSLWNFDREQLKIQSKGMITLPDMQHIQLKEIRGDREVVILEMGELQAGETLTREFKLEYRKDATSIQIGTVRVTASLSNVYQRIRAKVLLVLATQAVKTFFVSIFILLIFQFLIMKHLNTIALHMKEIRPGRLKTPLRLKRRAYLRKEPDLLDGVVSSINGMQTRLFNDYEAREAAERALRISQGKYRRLFEFSPVSIWQLDLSRIKSKLENLKQTGLKNLDDYFVDHPGYLDHLLSLVSAINVNGTSLGLFETESRQHLIREFPEIFRDALNTVYYQLAQALWQDKDYFETDFQGKTVTGRPIYIFLQWYISSAYEQDNPSESILAITDMTERRKIEDILIQSEKMASLGGLAAGMAHELNNPLGIMLQASQNIERRTSPDLRRNLETAADLNLGMAQLQEYMERRGILRYIEEIRDSGIRAARIIKNMLHFSRNSESNFTRVDINQVLEKSIELANNDYDLKKKYDFKNIRIVRRYGSDLVKVDVVETEIEQVFLNLLKNAAQSFHGQKTAESPEIIIKTSKEERELLIEIRDNGPGMDEETRKRVFEPFFSTKPVGQGTGLGLSISYMIITNNHGGTMSVDSAPGLGSRFLIRLPVQKT